MAPVNKKTVSVPTKTPDMPVKVSKKTSVQPSVAAEPVPKVVVVPEPPVVVVPEPPVQETVASTPVAVEPSPFSVLEEKITLLSSTLKDVFSQLRLVKKENDSLRRISDRVERKRANARTTPNGFAKPTKISDELCAFLKVPVGTEKSRTDVTREIHKYVKDNGLSDPANKRIILAKNDPTLMALLASTDSDEITYFNLQKFLKHHFVKVAPA